MSRNESTAVLHRLDAAQTAHLLPYGALAEAIAAMIRKAARGEAHAPVRSVVDLPGGGQLLLMPASDADYTCVKLVTVHARNAERGLPAIQGEVLLMDAATGERRLLLDGATVTSRRTAALSLVGAEEMGARGARRLLLIGAGVQARAQAEAFITEGGIVDVRVVARDRANAERLAAHLRTLGAQAEAVDDPAPGIESADLIVSATGSLQPVVPEGVRDGAVIVAIGAYRPDMAEVPAPLVRRCRVHVDTHEGARHEAGDLIQAGVDWAGVTAFGAPSPPDGRPALVKTVGHALWDLAAAELAYARHVAGA